MKAVNYQQHCASCHPLSVQIVGNDLDAKLAKAAEQFNHQPAPHKGPATVREALRQRYARFLDQHPEVLDRPVVAEPRQPLRAGPSTELAGGGRDAWLSVQLQTAERMLFTGAGGCRYCHDVKIVDRWPYRLGACRMDQRPTSARGGFPMASSTTVPPAHQVLDCTHCHAAPTSQTARDVLLPGVQSCRECHAPGKTARFDCVHCHQYHDTDPSPNRAGPLARLGISGRDCPARE